MLCWRRFGVHEAECRKGRPVLHIHAKCQHQFDPLMVCSECHEALDPREVRVSVGPGSRSRHRMTMDVASPRQRPAKRAKAKV
jgi:hypothetical protein